MKNRYYENFVTFDAVDFLSKGYEPEEEHEFSEESPLDPLNIPYSALKNFPATFSVYDVILSQLYGARDLQTGIHSRFAEIAAVAYLEKLGMTSILDLNVSAIQRTPYEWKDAVFASKFDVLAEAGGKSFYFDVKSQQNTEYKGFWHDLTNLLPGENILFVRTKGEIHDVNARPVGYILYPVLQDLFQINKRFMKKLPSFLFFNNSLKAFYEYAAKCDPLEVPLLLEEIIRTKRRHVSEEEHRKISQYVSASRNEDASQVLMRLLKHSASHFRKVSG